MNDNSDSDDELMSELKQGKNPVDTSGSIDWGDYSDRERVEAVLGTELEPVTVERIAAIANLEKEHVEDILGILSRDSAISRVCETTKGGEPAYEINPVALFVEDVVDLIEGARSREGLERYLATRQARREELVGKRGATEDEQEREYIEQAINLLDNSICAAEQALNLYDDVKSLSRSE